MTDQTIGYCSSHDSVQGGYIMLGSLDVLADDLPRARATDTVMANCGHTGTLVPGSITVLVDGLPASRVTDSFVGTYSGTVALGSFTVFTGN